MTTLRLVLGDQLNPCHSWFAAPDPDVLHVMMEIREETDYVLHHAQKIIAIFAAMRAFARALRDAGHRVHYLAIDDRRQPAVAVRQPRCAARRSIVSPVSSTRRPTMAARPPARRLRGGLPIPARMVDSEHFLGAREEAAALFAGRGQWLMERFYRHMRVRHGVLLDAAGKPAGGQWNFDHDNRKPWRGAPPEPRDPPPHARSRRAVATDRGGRGEELRRAAEQDFRWPLDRARRSPSSMPSSPRRCRISATTRTRCAHRRGGCSTRCSRSR
jgi:deoxyribodipyrimidine photolyase-related protein